MINRREFLIGSAAAGVSAATAWGQSTARVQIGSHRGDELQF